MPRKPHRKWVAIVAFLLPSLVAADQARDLSKLAPSDCFFFLAVPDATLLRNQWEKSPVGRFFNDPAVRKFSKPLRDEISNKIKELERRTAFNLAELDVYFPSEIVLFSQRLTERGEYFEIPLCFAAKTGLPRQRYLDVINRYIATLPPDAEKSRYKVGPVTVGQVNYRKEIATGRPVSLSATSGTVPAHFQYAFAGDVLLVTDGDASVMRRMIARLGNPPRESVADTPSLKRVNKLLAQGPQVVGYFAVGQIFDQLVRQFRKAAQENPLLNAFNPEALGIGRIKGFAAGCRFDEKRITVAATLDLPSEGPGVVAFPPDLMKVPTLDLPSEGPGVVAVLRHLRHSPLESAKIVPASAISYSSWAADLPGLYREARTMLQASAPPSSLALSMFLANLEAKLQMRVEDILATFAGEIASFSLARPGTATGTSNVYLFAVKDPKGLSRAINAIVAALQGKAKFESSRFLGYTIHTLRAEIPAGVAPPDAGPTPQFTIAWATTPDFLVVSDSTDGLKQVLELKAGKRTDSLARAAIYRRARLAMPRAISSFTLTDLGASGEIALREMMGFLSQPGADQFVGEWFDPSSPIPAETARRHLGLEAAAGIIEQNAISWVIVTTAP